MIAPIFTKELTLADPDHYQNFLAQRIKEMIKKRVPSNSAVFKELAQLWDQKIGQRPAILHPDIFFWLESNRQKEIGEQDLVELSTRVSGIIKSYEHMGQRALELGVKIDIGNESMRVADRLRRAELAAEDSGARISLNVIPCDVDLLKQALSILKSNNLPFLLEIERFITNIVMFEGQTVIGFTDFHNHGAIFIKYAMVKDNPIFLAEEITHESSHTVLNTIMVADPLVNNPKNERYKTPLRQDERPMFGLFHQLYVLSKLNRFYLSLKDHQEHSRHAQIKEKLLGALETVKAHARFTKLGQQIFTELERQSL